MNKEQHIEMILSEVIDNVSVLKTRKLGYVVFGTAKNAQVMLHSPRGYTHTFVRDAKEAKRVVAIANERQALKDHNKPYLHIVSARYEKR